MCGLVQDGGKPTLLMMNDLRSNFLCKEDMKFYKISVE